MSKISWTGKTWNPITGCTKLSSGCKNCYAERETERCIRRGQKKYQAGFDKVVCHSECLINPQLKWRSKSKMVFVNSMSDTFHKDVPDEFILKMFSVMAANPDYIFQVLTKRSDRLAEMAPNLPWPKNIWAGVTVENQKVQYRIDDLRSVPAEVKFLSIEPLLESIPNLDLSGIDWVIVGGESGKDSRPMKPEWVDNIRWQCHEALVPFFFKQWGKKANNPDPSDPTSRKKGGKMLWGEIVQEYPYAVDYLNESAA
ncbi:MAG: phage Gp37/Gp68 family protein [Candidatus Marinimicrobia bacterium]|nr:phage Gp37/Gp68 family protein [Candidatus Neomarinimicrobiota bacterium]